MERKNIEGIYPMPYTLGYTEGEFELDRELYMYINKGEADKTRLSLIKELWANFTLGVGTIYIKEISNLNSHGFIISKKGDTSGNAVLPDGFEYSINVGKDTISACGKDDSAMMHAFFTLLQLIRLKRSGNDVSCFALKCCNIIDRPTMKFRGLHLCVFPQTTLLFIKKVIRLAGFLKYSHIILEFWGMLKLEALAELSWNQAYSKEEIAPLISEANALGIEVIPMFNHFGHASASRVKYGKHVVLDQNPLLAPLFEPDGWTWCLSNPNTKRLMKKVRDEMIELCGEGSYFHLGFDEAYSFATCELCANTDKTKLLADYLNSLATDLAKQNRRGIIWGDTFLYTKEWKTPHYASSRPGNETHKTLDFLNKSLIIADWQYELHDCSVLTAEHFIKKGFDTLLSPWDNRNNIDTVISSAENLNAMGVLATTWDTLHEWFMIIPYISEKTWSADKTKTHDFDFCATCSASLLRKLVPVQGGNYEDAGWHANDTEK